jgi:hypothetical protein
MIFFSISKKNSNHKVFLIHFRQFYLFILDLKVLLTWDIKKIITIKFNNWVLRNKCENWLLLHLWEPACLRTDWLFKKFKIDTQPGPQQVKKMWEVPNTTSYQPPQTFLKCWPKSFADPNWAYFEFSSSNINVQGHILSTARFKAFEKSRQSLTLSDHWLQLLIP